MILDPIKAAVAPYMLAIKAGALLAAVGLVWWHGFNFGRDRWQGKYDTEAAEHRAAKASHAAVLRDLASKTKAAEAAAQAAGEKAASDRKANDERFKDARHEADQAKRDLARALRAGTVRLRDEWACPAARPAEGDAADLAPGQDAGADLRAAGAADLVAAGYAADRWIVWLQSELTSTRKACSP